MQISNDLGVNLGKNNNKVVTKKGFAYLSPLKCDTVSFGALKKTQFQGIDLIVVNKFKAPIEKFNTNDDLQKWCKEKIENITKKDYKGRTAESITQRKAMLKEWFDYVQNENDAYNNAFQLLILDGITKDLDEKSDSIPPVLNKGILAQTIDELQNKVKINQNLQVNFSKQYKLNLQNSILNETESKTNETKTGWIKIPSKDNDPENFDKNIEKLKMLSHHNWCTKSFNAEPYLSQGDFHVYLESGKPKIGVRFVGDKIQEIQGEKNNGKIPLSYFDITSEHIKNEQLSYQAKKEIEYAEQTKIKLIEFCEKHFPNGIENYSEEEILNRLGIQTEKDKDGMLTLSSYSQLNDFSFEDIGIDENKLFKKIKAIKGDAIFRNTLLKSIDKLEYIGGTADFQYTEFKDTGSLKHIGGNALFKNSGITDLKNLEYIGGHCQIDKKITDLGKLAYIGKDMSFSHTKLKDTGNIKYIGGYADFSDSEIQDLKVLESVGGDVYFNHSGKIKISNLKNIGRDAIFTYSNITDLGSIENIGRDLLLDKSEIMSPGNLKKVGGVARFDKDTYDNPLIYRLKNRLVANKIPIEVTESDDYLF